MTAAGDRRSCLEVPPCHGPRGPGGGQPAVTGQLPPDGSAESELYDTPHRHRKSGVSALSPCLIDEE